MNDDSPTTMEAIGLFFQCMWYALAAIFLFMLGLIQLIARLFTHPAPTGKHVEEPDVWRKGY